MNYASEYRKFIEGDDGCLECIVEAYYRGLVLYLTRFTGNYADAEDILQETITYLAIKKPRFKGDSGFKTWLYKIATNKAKNYLRKHKVTITELNEEIIAPEEYEAESSYIDSYEKKQLYKCIKELPEDYRQVIYLAYFEEMRADEIAKTMGKNKKAIENLLYRAKSKLKERLDNI